LTTRGISFWSTVVSGITSLTIAIIGGGGQVQLTFNCGKPSLRCLFFQSTDTDILIISHTDFRLSKMYLLELVHGELILREFQEENVPPYAVLSQINEDENDEVSFKDILENTDQGKAGYAIIRLCAEAAAVNKLKYIYVGKCCGDKNSSTATTEAINSSFHLFVSHLLQ